MLLLLLLLLLASSQGALVIVMDYLQTQRLRAPMLLAAGAGPALAALIGPAPGETTTLALEALGCLLSSAGTATTTTSTAGPAVPQQPHAGEGADDVDVAVSYTVAPLVDVLHTCLGVPAAPQPQQRHVVVPAAAAAPPRGGGKPPLHVLQDGSHWVAHAGAAQQQAGGAPRGEGGAEAAWLMRQLLEGRDDVEEPAAAAGEAEGARQEDREERRRQRELHRLHGAFFGATTAMRMARLPGAARLLVRGGALPMLCSGLACGDACVCQACLLALYRLARVGSHADNLLQLMRAGGMHALQALLAMHSGGEPPAPATTLSAAGPRSGAAREQQAADEQAGGGGGGGGGGATLARDLAASLLLDMALLPEAPAYAAEHGVVAPLVQVCARARDRTLALGAHETSRRWHAHAG